MDQIQQRSISLLVIEHRDDVFAQLVADLHGFGVSIQRARSGVQAVSAYQRGHVHLVLCNRDLPDENVESGWECVTRLKELDPSARLWIYASSFSYADKSGALYSGIEDLVYYGDDVSSLSRQLMARLRNCRQRRVL